MYCCCVLAVVLNVGGNPLFVNEDTLADVEGRLKFGLGANQRDTVFGHTVCLLSAD